MCRQAGRFGFFVLGPRALTPPQPFPQLGWVYTYMRARTWELGGGHIPPLPPADPS